MGVALPPEELADFLRDGHTLIFTTIRKSGEPFATPMWYAYIDGCIYIRTLGRSAKVGHVRRDPRVCCTVETGDAWVALKALIANCDAEILPDDETLEMVGKELDRKYASFRPPHTNMPKATRKHYSGGSVVVKCTPRPGEIRSWYNRKIRMKA